jgi:putative ABC transport system permease protein
MHDVRYAWRRLRATPVVSGVAIFTMALGIGTATTVFSVANGVLFHPLPYAEPGRLEMVWDRWTGWPATWLSNAEFLDYRDKAQSFSAVGAFTDDSRNLTGDPEPDRVHVGIVSAGVFRALGVQPALGRAFVDDEDRAGGPRVAVISDGLWRRRYGSDRGILGRQVMLDDSSTTIVGVMPASFHLPLDFAGDPSDIWVPLALGTVDPTARGNHYLNLIGRLRPGVTAAAADREVQAMAHRMVADYPRAYPPDFAAFTRSVTSQVTGDVRPTVLVLTTAVGFVLLIACANVANLLLARAYARQREIALRAALGASHWRIITQLLTEGAVLVGISGCVGVLLALLGIHLVATDAPRSVPRIAEVGLDAPVLLFTSVVTVATGLFCGILPALHAARPDLHAALKEAARGAPADRRGERIRRFLIASEVALSVMLLIGAGLLTRSFARLEAVDPGFDSSSVLTARMSLSAEKYPTDASVRAFYREVVERTRTLPGVTSSAVVRVLPMTGVMGDWDFRIEGRTGTPNRPDGTGDWQVVSPAYFGVMHVRLTSGRMLSETDDERAPNAVLVNDALARRAWPAGSPVGQRIRMGGDTAITWRTVVGVVANVRHRGLDADPRPEIYLPHTQWVTGAGAVRDMYIVLRSTRDPSALTSDLRRTVRALDPNLPLASVRSMDEVLSDAAASRRISFIVVATIAAAAAAIAAVGLFGVVSYAVEQRTTEIGIRRALGASTGTVIALVARHGALAVVPGILAGLAAAVLLARFMSALLFQVHATDAVTFIGVTALVSVIAVVATYVPARRAAAVDPLTAVRGGD